MPMDFQISCELLVVFRGIRIGFFVSEDPRYWVSHEKKGPWFFGKKKWWNPTELYFGDYFINHDISGSRKIKQPGLNRKYPAVFVFFRGKRCLEQNVATVICIDFLIENVMHYHRRFCEGVLLKAPEKSHPFGTTWNTGRKGTCISFTLRLLLLHTTTLFESKLLGSSCFLESFCLYGRDRTKKTT